jgi:hypothetical protein
MATEWSTLRKASLMLETMSILISITYVIVLLKFLNAPIYIWIIWLIAATISIESAALALWVRNESFVQQFADIMKNADKEYNRRRIEEEMDEEKDNENE